MDGLCSLFATDAEAPQPQFAANPAFLQAVVHRLVLCPSGMEAPASTPFVRLLKSGPKARRALASALGSSPATLLLPRKLATRFVMRPSDPLLSVLLRMLRFAAESLPAQQAAAVALSVESTPGLVPALASALLDRSAMLSEMALGIIYELRDSDGFLSLLANVRGVDEALAELQTRFTAGGGFSRQVEEVAEVLGVRAVLLPSFDLAPVSASTDAPVRPQSKHDGVADRLAEISDTTRGNERVNGLFALHQGIRYLDATRPGGLGGPQLPLVYDKPVCDGCGSLQQLQRGMVVLRCKSCLRVR